MDKCLCLEGHFPRATPGCVLGSMSGLSPGLEEEAIICCLFSSSWEPSQVIRVFHLLLIGRVLLFEMWRLQTYLLSSDHIL